MLGDSHQSIYIKRVFLPTLRLDFHLDSHYPLALLLDFQVHLSLFANLDGKQQTNSRNHVNLLAGMKDWNESAKILRAEGLRRTVDRPGRYHEKGSLISLFYGCHG